MRRSFLAFLMATAALLLPSTASAQGSRKLQQLFRSDMLGVQVPFLETITGPARRVSPPFGNTMERREYRIDGCNIWALTRGTEVRAYGLRLTRSCTFPYRAMIANAPDVQANTLTFEQLDGRFEPACWYSCGNAADPAYSTFVEYSRADGMAQARGTAVYRGETVGRAVDAVLGWARQRLPEDDVTDGERVAAIPGYSAFANRAFRSVRFSELEIGYLTP